MKNIVRNLKLIAEQIEHGDDAGFKSGDIQGIVNELQKIASLLQEVA